MPMLFPMLVLGLVALMVASSWAIFSKAGEAGWKSLIPIYGAVVMLRIVGRPWWWVLLLAVPLVNIVPAIMVCMDLARVFGKGGGFAVGLMLVTPVFWLMLAFGNAQYVSPDRQDAAPSRARAA